MSIGAQGEQGEKGEEGSPLPHYQRILFWIWVIVFSVTSIYALRENRQRINDIQNSRILACKQNYTVIADVFSQFFPPPQIRTHEQDVEIQKFLDSVNKGKKTCIKTVKKT